MQEFLSLNTDGCTSFEKKPFSKSRIDKVRENHSYCMRIHNWFIFSAVWLMQLSSPMICAQNIDMCTLIWAQNVDTYTKLSSLESTITQCPPVKSTSCMYYGTISTLIYTYTNNAYLCIHFYLFIWTHEITFWQTFCLVKIKSNLN